jgi:4-hydroxythreonine-4-phosphate dehydrogenase
MRTIAISTGDPAGIGPEVVLKALADRDLSGQARWLVVGSAAIWPEVSAFTGIRVEELHDAQFVDVPAALPSPFRFGELSAEAGAAALRYVEVATRLCLERKADAMVTAPVNKEAVSLSGTPFTGHTEYIAELCGNADTRMLLVNERLSVIHVSTHCSRDEAVREADTPHRSMRAQPARR